VRYTPNCQDGSRKRMGNTQFRSTCLSRCKRRCFYRSRDKNVSGVRQRFFCSSFLSFIENEIIRGIGGIVQMPAFSRPFARIGPFNYAFKQKRKMRARTRRFLAGNTTRTRLARPFRRDRNYLSEKTCLSTNVYVPHEICLVRLNGNRAREIVMKSAISLYRDL